MGATMKRLRFPSVLAIAALLAGCGTGAPVSPPQGAQTPPGVQAYAQRPELQQAEVQRLLRERAGDPLLLTTLREAYGEAPLEQASALTRAPSQRPPVLSSQSLESDRLDYIKRVAAGSLTDYEAEYAKYGQTPGLPYPGVDWTTDGCTIPEPLGLGHSRIFDRACQQHDFSYQNFMRYERTQANKDTADRQLLKNMKLICNERPQVTRPACFVAAYAFFVPTQTTLVPYYHLVPYYYLVP